MKHVHVCNMQDCMLLRAGRQAKSSKWQERCIASVLLLAMYGKYCEHHNRCSRQRRTAQPSNVMPHCCGTLYRRRAASSSSSSMMHEVVNMGAQATLTDLQQ